MKITFAATGKTVEDYLKTGEKIYFDRLRHYITVNMVELSPPKKPGGLSPERYRKHEAKQLMKLIEKFDCVVLLDEKGKQYNSGEFAMELQKLMNRGIKNLLFISSGPYGFDKEIVSKADLKLSLSRMTFSHQMVRLIFLEQLYRAFTIIRGEKYHNE